MTIKDDTKTYAGLFFAFDSDQKFNLHVTQVSCYPGDAASSKAANVACSTSSVTLFPCKSMHLLLLQLLLLGDSLLHT